MSEIHYIKNEILEVAINSLGAELCSIKSVSNSKEFMWNANPNIWASTSPVLFPIVGGLKNNEYSHQGKIFKLGRHGFIRNNKNMELHQKTSDSISFVLEDNLETLEVYPFNFKFIITYQLIANALHVKYSVYNKTAGEIYFSLGGHPAFACPFNPTEAYEDYFLEFEKHESVRTWVLDQNGQIEREGVMVLENSRILNLHRNMFNHDALIFKNLKSKQVSLKSKNHAFAIRVDFSDFPYLGLWAKPAADFICIEPWLGIADSSNTTGQLMDKEAIIKLEKNQDFKASYSISIVE